MNENKFTGKAELYSKYRPSYSEKLIESFKTHLGFISEEFPRSIQIITK